MEAYPFVARQLLSEDRPALQKALQDVLYSGGTTTSKGVKGKKGKEELRTTRLSVLLNSAMGVVNRESGAFVDLDTVPQGGVSLGEALSYLASDKATSLRALLQVSLEEGVIEGAISLYWWCFVSFGVVH